MAEPMIAPAASPPTTPAATPQPWQRACAEDGNATARVAAAASAMIVCFMGVLTGLSEFGPDHPPKVVTRSLRADEPRFAPADEIAVTVMKRSAGPVTARATSRVGGTVTFIGYIAGLRCVVARLAVGDRTADDRAADNASCHTRTDRAAIAAGIGRGRGAHGADRHGGDCREREHRLLHGYFLQGQVGGVPTT